MWLTVQLGPHLCFISILYLNKFILGDFAAMDLLALLFVMVYCVFVTFPYGVLGQVWYLIVSIPDLYLLLYIFWR